MAEQNVLKQIICELDNIEGSVQENQLLEFASLIQKADHVFVGGVGRSGFSARSFANRLMHLGLSVYFVGETTTPAIGEGDVLVLCTGSGETGSLKEIAKRAKSCGAKLACVTISDKSTIGAMADAAVLVPGASSKIESGENKSIQPMGSAFEQMSLLIFDSVVMILLDRLHETSEEMFARHANLE